MTSALKPHVKVLMTTFNGAAWCRAQIDSILGQHGVKVELVVSDDHSGDETPTILEAYARAGHLRWSRPGEPTRAAGANFFHLIRSEPAGDAAFVALSDHDDIWLPDKLARATRKLASSGGGYSAAVLAEWPDGHRRLLGQSSRMRRADHFFEGAGQGCTFVMTADFYARAREALESSASALARIHYHDWTLYALARTWGLPWCFDAEPAMRYRQHGSNDTGSRAGLAGIRKRLSLVANGWYARQLLAVAEVLHKVNPEERVLGDWLALLRAPPNLARRVKLARFSVCHGRRRLTDRALVAVFCLAGWI